MFNKLIKFITKPRLKYQPLINVEISKQAILHNLDVFRSKYPSLLVAPVLKSNAYGHGLVQVAKILDNQKVAFLIVDSFYEALVLRRAAVKSPILVLGYSTMEQIEQKKLKDVAYTIISIEMLEDLAAKLTRPTKIHLKIDTGMSRQGILLSELEKAIPLVKSNRNIILEGACSHLADAEVADSELTKLQITNWANTVTFFKQNFPEIKYYHLSNTAGTYYSRKFESNVCRVGLGLYGYTLTREDPIDLFPALSLKTIISSVKRYDEGTRVGYNGTFTTVKPTSIAALPMGFNEGIDRRLSNKGACLVGGKICPILGRVSMNITTIDVTNVPNAKAGTSVTVISNNKNDPNSVSNLTVLCDTVPYDILVHIPAYLRRTVV